MITQNVNVMPIIFNAFLGQSRSLIVALGDYYGGEIVVETEAHDIRLGRGSGRIGLKLGSVRLGLVACFDAIKLNGIAADCLSLCL